MQIIHVNISKEFEKGKFLARANNTIPLPSIPSDPAETQTRFRQGCNHKHLNMTFLSSVSKSVSYGHPEVGHPKCAVQIRATLHIRRHKTLLQHRIGQPPFPKFIADTQHITHSHQTRPVIRIGWSAVTGQGTTSIIQPGICW